MLYLPFIAISGGKRKVRSCLKTQACRSCNPHLKPCLLPIPYTTSYDMKRNKLWWLIQGVIVGVSYVEEKEDFIQQVVICCYPSPARPVYICTIIVSCWSVHTHVLVQFWAEWAIIWMFWAVIYVWATTLKWFGLLYMSGPVSWSDLGSYLWVGLYLEVNSE